jgi:hypothetical protein
MPAAKPAQREPRHNLWLWLVVLLGLPILVTHLPKQLQPEGVARSLVGPPRQQWIELRRALPAVPRTLPVTSVSSASDPQIGTWYPVTFADGTTLQVYYGGRLASPVDLLFPGNFIGDARVINNHYWIWMTRPGATIPSWVDP